MDQLITYITTKANRANTQTEFLKPISYNDRYGCVTVPNEDGTITADSERVYPPLNNTLVSVFLKRMYATIKANAAEEESTQDTTEVNETIETVSNLTVNVTEQQRETELKLMTKNHLWFIACTHYNSLLNDNAFFYTRNDILDMILDAEYPESSFTL